MNWMVVGGSVMIMQPGRRGEPEAPQQVTVDYVPEGEVEVHRELTVRATDGDIGQIQGLVVDPGGHQVTHVLLQEGHMRGRKEVAIRWRRDQDRDSAYPSQPYQTPGERPAARGR